MWLRTNPPTLASLGNIDTMNEAADRIEELETALRDLMMHCGRNMLATM